MAIGLATFIVLISLAGAGYFEADDTVAPTAAPTVLAPTALAPTALAPTVLAPTVEYIATYLPTGTATSCAGIPGNTCTSITTEAACLLSADEFNPTWTVTSWPAVNRDVPSGCIIYVQVIDGPVFVTWNDPHTTPRDCMPTNTGYSCVCSCP